MFDVFAGLAQLKNADFPATPSGEIFRLTERQDNYL
jgi:hypothetical protein